MLGLVVGIAFASSFFGPIVSALIALFLMYGFLHYAYTLLLTDGVLLNVFYPFASASLLYLILTLMHYIVESRQKEFIKEKFSKKVSKAVAENLIKQNSQELMKGSEREITIFFSDIRGFTNISENIGSPKKLINYLNQYMTPMSDIIVKQEGTIDKFIGDAIMAYWNAPLDVVHHANKALDAAIMQLKELENLNKRFVLQNLPIVDIGIGLNSGLGVVGEMGSSGRSDYTVIGDTVNIGSRLESLCKQYGAKIILSQTTKDLLINNEEYIFRELDHVRVKGKKRAVCIYECLGNKSYEIAPLQGKEQYEEALQLYKSGDFVLAHEKFTALVTMFETKLYALYLERCAHYMKNPPENFDGVFTFTSK